MLPVDLIANAQAVTFRRPAPGVRAYALEPFWHFAGFLRAPQGYVLNCLSSYKKRLDVGPRSVLIALPLGATELKRMARTWTTSSLGCWASCAIAATCSATTIQNSAVTRRLAAPWRQGLARRRHRSIERWSSRCRWRGLLRERGTRGALPPRLPMSCGVKWRAREIRTSDLCLPPQGNENHTIRLHQPKTSTAKKGLALGSKPSRESRRHRRDGDVLVAP